MSLLRHLGLRPLTPAQALYLRPATRFYSDWRSETASKWNSPEEIEQARHWIETFKVEDIPKKACTVGYSASSGPGGQNVNKLSTKATLHLDLGSKARTFLPDYILRKVRENSRHLTRNDEIVIQADGSRKQSENMEEVYHRLHKIIVSCVSKDVPGVTSAEKKKRVAQLQKQDANLRKKLKTMQKSKKDSRRNRRDD
ncbi:hypothetical protein K440DRAFT_177694 [Wilcoxina mikolae CBS 423.85]|nr:hypothetical protein K440DRAFT_177694 [Wilcoxina mikolae CBS 423.85]